MSKINVKVHKGDITKLNVDCIVNAANSELSAGSGVCGAIYDAAGFDDMSRACSAFGGCETGEAIITPGFNLPAKHVVHAVGPVYDAKNNNMSGLLKSAYLQSLWLAEENGAKSIAFPLISTGVYGYPKSEAIMLALDAITIYQAESNMPLDEITICTFDDGDYELTKQVVNSKR
jgi:O-acetyl-ADP-ribose deacetylase (regulator of RNase III)